MGVRRALRAACSLHATSSEALGSFSAASRLSASSADAGGAPGAAGRLAWMRAPGGARRRIRARMRAPGVGAGVDAGADAAAGAWRGRRCGCGRGCGGGRLAWARMRAVVLGFRRRDSEKITIGINGTLLAVRTACSGGGRRIRRAAFPQVAGMQLLAFPRSRVCSRARFIPYCPLAWAHLDTFREKRGIAGGVFWRTFSISCKMQDIVDIHNKMQYISYTKTGLSVFF